MRSSILILLASSLLAATPDAQSLLRDIRIGRPQINPGSEILELSEFGNVVLFGARDSARGQQLWRTDGTSAGTSTVTAFPPPEGVHFHLWATVPRNGLLVFPAGRFGDRELWRSDGTRAGTYRIADIRPGPVGSNPRDVTPVGNLVFFAADDGVHGEELWRTDGTAAGTFMVADLGTGTLPHVGSLTELGQRLVFRAGNDDLWISDGTTAGTSRLRDMAWTSDLRAWNGAVWFQGDDGVNGHELWRTDGTPAGTVMVADIAPGSAGARPRELTPAGARLYFSADDGSSGVELWSTDGTMGGTRRVRDINPGAGGSTVRELTALGTRVIFAADDGSGQEPWISDGSAAGTLRLGDLEPGARGSGPRTFRPFANSSLCAFRAATTRTGLEAFVTDGTVAGTRLLRDIGPGRRDGIPLANHFSFGVVGNEIVFPADDGVHGIELWISDGSTANTRLLRDVDPGIPPGSGLEFMGKIGDRIFFNADDGSGQAVWETDGSAAGTVPSELPSGPFRSPLVELNGRWLYLDAYGGLFSTDGTGAGTELLATMPRLSGTTDLIVANGRLMFTRGNTLWSSDGSAAGTGVIRTFQIRPMNGVPPRLHATLRGAAYLTAEDQGAMELWRTDGTTAGTTAITAFGGLSSIGPVIAAGPRLLFAATDPAAGNELFASDGTAAGTHRLADLLPGTNGSYPSELTAVDGGAFFVARNSSATSDLWFTDGTPGGERRVLSLDFGASQLGLLPFGPGVLFGHRVGSTRQPWFTDGTSVGTRRLADVHSAVPVTMIGREYVSSFTIAGSGRVALFAADDGEHGRETWRTDGTAIGTWRVTDIGAEQISSNPRSWVRLGSRILFAASEPSVGEELFTMPLVATGDSLAAPRVEGCAGSRGVPVLAPIGVPALGNGAFALRVSDALPRALAALGFGAALRQPFGPCTNGTSFAVSVTFQLDANGVASQPVPVPMTPSLLGAELATQAFVVDPAGGFQGLLAFTNDLLLVVGH